MKRLNTLLILLPLFLLIACNKEDSSPLVAFFSDIYDAAIPIEGNKEIYLTVTVITNGVHINKITLESNDKTYGIQQVIDSVPDIGTNDTRKINLKYKTHYYAEETMVTLTSRVFTEEGEMMEIKKYLAVKPSDISWNLQESVTMYSAGSSRKYGFSIPQMTTVFPEIIDNDTLLFYDRAHEDEEQKDAMTNSWESRTGIYFARFESLDFSNSNIAAIEQAYNLSARDNVILDIKANDLLIFGSKKDVYGLIKVLLTIDDEGHENDRYVFSIKCRKDIFVE
ncbi:MAG: hypothetical protein IJU35_08510 [Paludibacteraceae bacterium]|nr:hypothetical protein [Paludibacteraceae bacterium]